MSLQTSHFFDFESGRRNPFKTRPAIEKVRYAGLFSFQGAAAGPLRQRLRFLRPLVLRPGFAVGCAAGCLRRAARFGASNVAATCWPDASM